MKRQAIDILIALEPGKNYNVYTLGGHMHTGRVEPVIEPGLPETLVPEPDLVYLRHIIGPGTQDLLIAIDIDFITAVEEIP